MSFFGHGPSFDHPTSFVFFVFGPFWVMVRRLTIFRWSIIFGSVTNHLTLFFGHGPSFDHPTSFGLFFGPSFWFGDQALIMVRRLTIQRHWSFFWFGV